MAAQGALVGEVEPILLPLLNRVLQVHLKVAGASLRLDPDSAAQLQNTLLHRLRFGGEDGLPQPPIGLAAQEALA